jgi:hypothetical protein
MGTVFNRIDLSTVMQQQAPTGHGFYCETCQNYKGGCVCKLGYFIMCVGANTSNCLSYQEERRKK